MTQIDVFISYKREERELADQASRALTAAGYVAVTDLNIQKATDFGEAIDRMIKEASVVVVLWTQASAASDWVRKEANEAERQEKYLGVRIEPVSVDDLPFRVRGNNWLDLSEAAFADGLPDMVTEVRRLVGAAQRNEVEAESATKLAEGDLEFYQVVHEIGDVGGYRKYASVYPQGTYIDDAHGHIKRLTRWYRPFTRFPFFASVGAIAAGIGAYVALFPPSDGDTSALQNDLKAKAAQIATLEQEHQAEVEKLETAIATQTDQGADDDALKSELAAQKQKFAELVTRYDRTVKIRTQEAFELKRENEDLSAQVADLEEQVLKLAAFQDEVSLSDASSTNFERDGNGRILGVKFEELNNENRAKFGLSGGLTSGLVVVGIASSGRLYQSGVRSGDLISLAGQDSIRTENDLLASLNKAKAIGIDVISLRTYRRSESYYIALSLSN